MNFHLTPELARAFRQGKITHDELVQIVFDHLPAVCPHCRSGLASLVACEGSTDARLLLHSFAALLAHHEPEVLRAEEMAVTDLLILSKVSHNARRKKILRAYRHFRGVVFVGLLIDEAQSHLHSAPSEAYHWAELAWTAACQSPRMPAELLALALAQMANARRAGGDLSSAEEHFRHVRYLVARHPVTDLSSLARIFHLEGSLRKDQRQFEDAKKMLDRAVMLYRLTGEQRELAEVFLTSGSAFFAEGAVPKAIIQVRRALKLLHEKDAPLQYLWARYNLACYLVDDDQIEKGASILIEDDALFRLHFPPVDQLRLSWLAGRIAIRRQELEWGEKTLIGTRDGFLAEGIGYPAAMVSLDLALLYARSGRWEELKRLAQEIAPIFSSQDVHREVLAALLLFQEGVRQETLTLQTLEALASYLRDARNDASLRFEPPPA
jgi:tetratricopeptide (TPR) repeat protein